MNLREVMPFVKKLFSLCISHTSGSINEARNHSPVILQASITIPNNSLAEWVWKVKKVTEDRYNWPRFLLHRVKSSYTHFDKDPEGLYINQIVDKWSQLQISTADTWHKAIIEVLNVKLVYATLLDSDCCCK